MNEFRLTPWFISGIIIVDNNLIKDTLKALDNKLEELKLEEKNEGLDIKSNLQ